MLLPKGNREEEKYKKIIIEYDDKINLYYSFKTYNQYYPFLVNNISREQFNQIIDDMNIIICNGKMKKAKFDKIDKNIFIYAIFFIFAFIFILIYILLFYFAPRKDKNQQKLKISGIIFFCVTIFMLILLQIYNSARKIEADKTLLEFYKDDMIKYIDNLNIIWKETFIFNFDESNKNIICFSKYDKSKPQSQKFDNNNNNNILDFSENSYEHQKYYSEADLYSNKSNQLFLKGKK